MAKIPVFVVHGFLESGKTQFAMETLSDEYFSDGERNLVIAGGQIRIQRNVSGRVPEEIQTYPGYCRV